MKPPTQPPTWRWRRQSPPDNLAGWFHGRGNTGSHENQNRGQWRERHSVAAYWRSKRTVSSWPRAARPSGGTNPSGLVAAAPADLDRSGDGTGHVGGTGRFPGDGTGGAGTGRAHGTGHFHWDWTKSRSAADQLPKMRSTAPLTGLDTLSGAVSSTGHLRGTGQVRGTDSRSRASQGKSGIKLLQSRGLRQA